MAIPREQVSLVSDDVAYAYGNLKYVVTTDGGKTWIQSDLFTRLENIPTGRHSEPNDFGRRNRNPVCGPGG